MASYLAFLSESNSDYYGVFENIGNVDGYKNGYVGNMSSLAAQYLMYKLPANFPKQGDLLGSYTVDYADITAASLRVVETSLGTRGGYPLTMKVSPMTGVWTPTANWSNVPAWNSAVYNEYSGFGAAPSSSYHDTQDGYHAAKYKYLVYKYTYPGEDFVSTSYIYPTSPIHGTVLNQISADSPIYSGGYEYQYSYKGKIDAYYDYYYKYHTFSAIDTLKECVKNSATGLIFWFDISNATFNRKSLTTTLEGADSRRLAITITFTEGSGRTVNFKGVKDGAFVQVADFKGVYGGAFVNVGGMKAVRTVDGVKTWVDVIS